MQNNKIAVIIPSYNPSAKLVRLVDELKQSGLQTIIIVNDGSEEEAEKVFSQLTQVTLLSHSQNRGKGAALKTGMAFVQTNLHTCDFVLCCDDDGQHTPKDIAKVAAAGMARTQITLGSRAFDKKVPLKSLCGNKIIAFLFRVLFGKKIRDTQTGLRLIPSDAIGELLTISYNRFEFEFASLIHFLKSRFEIVEVPIETIYFENNRSTKFKSVSDSWLIIRTLFSHFF